MNCSSALHEGSYWYALGNVYANNNGWSSSVSYTSQAVMRQIQYELMINGPLTVQIPVYEDLYSYKSGTWQHLTQHFNWINLKSNIVREMEN